MTATKLAPSQREEWSRQTLFLGLRVYLVQNRPTPAPLPPPDTTTAKPRGRWVPGYSTTAVNNRPTPAPRPPPYSHQPVTFMQGQRIRQDFTKTPCPCSLAAARRLLKDAAEATGTHAPLVHACCRSAVHNRTNMFTTPAPRPPPYSVTTATGYGHGRSACCRSAVHNRRRSVLWSSLGGACGSPRMSSTIYAYVIDDI